MLVKQQSFNESGETQREGGEDEEEDYFEGFEFDEDLEKKSSAKYDDEIEKPGDLRATIKRRKDRLSEEESYYS